MLIFHEGLPGSGKSYESIVKHVIPALKKGRKVFARVNGLNYAKIATLCDISEERCKELLIPIEEEQVMDVHDVVENDSLVVLDELQNFFPSGRGKLSEGITKFVTEHRHRGIDIIAMGQSIADVHNLWRRRTQRKIQFLKLDMVGRKNSYKWTAYQGTLNGKGDIVFHKINSGSTEYEKEYFGSYASHQSDTDNTENYNDDRTNILKTKGVKYGIPAFICVFIYSLYYLFGFFTKTPEVEQQEPIAQSTIATPQPLPETPKALPQEQKKPEPTHADFVQENNHQYEQKLTYLDLRNGLIWDLIVIWYDSTNKVKDRVYYNDLLALGYEVKNVGYGILATKGDYKALYRFKPNLEPNYSIPEDTRNTLASN